MASSLLKDYKSRKACPQCGAHRLFTNDSEGDCGGIHYHCLSCNSTFFEYPQQTQFRQKTEKVELRKGSQSICEINQLKAFFPEECVAEIGVVYRRMKKANASPLAIRLRLMEEFMTLLWVFYIQIKLENLRLPSGDRTIDD